MTAQKTQMDVSLLLPFYVNGSLTVEEAREVKAALAADPELAAEYKALLSIRDTWKSEADLIADSSPGEAGLDRLMASVEEYENGAVDVIETTVPANSNAPFVRRAVGLAAAAAIGAFSMAVLVQQNSDPTGARMVSGPEYGLSEGPVMTVRFRDDAALADISAVLRASDLIIVDGPSATGLFRLGGLDSEPTPDLARALRARNDLFELVDDPE